MLAIASAYAPEGGGGGVDRATEAKTQRAARCPEAEQTNGSTTQDNCLGVHGLIPNN
jgi:hypothetical protein